MWHVSRRASVSCLAAVLCTLCWLAAARPALAEAAAAPVSCQVGAYVISLYNVDPDADTFDADLWLWSVCPSKDLHPLQTMEFVNANAVEVLLDFTEPRGDLFWSNRKVRATFRHDWDERDFPFDHQLLTIVLEEGADDVQRFVYEPDTAATTYDHALQLPGWTITDFSLRPGTAIYNTTFGDPTLTEGGSSTYSRLTLEFDLARTDLSVFFKLTAVVYAAFVLSLITYVMPLETTTALSPQFQILSAALFAAAVNLVTASATIGKTSEFTLVDKVHIIVLAYILFAGFVVVVSRVLVERGWSATAIARLNYRVGVVAALSFIAINVALIVAAARTA